MSLLQKRDVGIHPLITKWELSMMKNWTPTSYKISRTTTLP